FASGFEPSKSGRLQESFLKRSYLGTKFSIGKDVIVLSTPVRKEDHLISTWVLIRNDSRITGKLEVIGSSTGLVPTNALASSDGTIPRLWGSRLLGTAPVADPQ